MEKRARIYDNETVTTVVPLRPSITTISKVTRWYLQPIWIVSSAIKFYQNRKAVAYFQPITLCNVLFAHWECVKAALCGIKQRIHSLADIVIHPRKFTYRIKNKLSFISIVNVYVFPFLQERPIFFIVTVHKNELNAVILLPLFRQIIPKYQLINYGNLQQAHVPLSLLNHCTVNKTLLKTVVLWTYYLFY